MLKAQVRQRRRPSAAERVVNESTTATSVQAVQSSSLEELRTKVKVVTTEVPTDQLKPANRRTRRHLAKNVRVIANGIREHGFLNPILVDRDYGIICGHGRWLAAQQLKLEQVPVIVVDHLTPEQRRLYAILDNRSAELSEWDPEALRLEFAELELSLDLNLELSGFATSEIDRMRIVPLSAPGGEGGCGEDDAAEAAEDDPEPDSPVVTRVGDVWHLGAHRLICGDSREQETFDKLLGNERVQMVFGDPPFNLAATTYSGLGKHQHGNFAMAAGELSPSEFAAFLTTVFSLAAQYSVDGSIHYHCIDWRHLDEMLQAGHAAYSELKNLIVWKKHSAGMGSFYRSQHELIFVWKHGSAPHINNFGLGETGRYRTNVWEYRGNSGFHKERDEELSAHATVKPWSLVADAIRDCSKRGGIILDPWGGSGTTMVAAERTGRKARLIEQDPRYCDRAIARVQKVTPGIPITLVATGQSFAEVAAKRSCEEEAN